MRATAEFAMAAAIIAAATVAYAVVAEFAAPPASGLVGHSLGVAGLLAMLAGTFGYSWRKQPHRSGPGPMQRWLQAHVITGLVGPWLVLLHTAFAFRGIAGVTFLLMVLVVASGVVGRIAYVRAAKGPGAPGTLRPEVRPVLAAWWLVHVPVAIAMFALAVVHSAAALYYATLLR